MRGGGSEQQVLLLLRHLDRLEFAPELYLTERVGDLLPLLPDDVPIHSFQDATNVGGLYFPGRALRQQANHLRELIVSRDIDVVYDRTFHMTMIAGPATRSTRVPRVSTIVSPPELALPAVERRFVWLKRRRLAKAYRHSDTVVAVSQQAASSAESYYGLTNGSVQVVRNPVDVDRLQNAAAEESFSRDDRLTLVCVGRMTREKGHHDLISAMELLEANGKGELPSMRLLMIGDGPLRGDLQLRWDRSTHHHQIEFLGTQANPAPMIAAADALVLPSHFEGMPNVVLEAMALETPVIATRSGGTVELECEAPAILWAEPRNPASLADAIHELSLDQDSARQRAQRARLCIGQHHDVAKTTRQIESLLRLAADDFSDSSIGLPLSVTCSTTTSRRRSRPDQTN